MTPEQIKLLKTEIGQLTESCKAIRRRMERQDENLPPRPRLVVRWRGPLPRTRRDFSNLKGW